MTDAITSNNPDGIIETRIQPTVPLLSKKNEHWRRYIWDKNKPWHSRMLSIGGIFSLFGAFGNGWSNRIGVMEFIEKYWETVRNWSQGLGIGLGIFSLLVNFIINITAFGYFVGKKKNGSYFYNERPNIGKYNKWGEIWYYLGIGLYVFVSLLFAATAFAISDLASDVEKILSPIIGIFVAIATVIPEIQTWLDNYWNKEYVIYTYSSFIQALSAKLTTFWDWLTKDKLSSLVSFINVCAMNLTFAYGFYIFLAAITCPIMPALIVSLAIGGVVGYLTEQPFYRVAIQEAVALIYYNYQKLFVNPEFYFAVILTAGNGVANALATYVGLQALVGVVISVFAFTPPGWIFTGFAIVLGIVSFALGLKFWIKYRIDFKLSEQNNPISNSNDDEKNSQETARLLVEHNSNLESTFSAVIKTTSKNIAAQPSPADTKDFGSKKQPTKHGRNTSTTFGTSISPTATPSSTNQTNLSLISDTLLANTIT